MARLRPTAIFQVKQHSPYQWSLRDRSHKSAIVEYRLQYYLSRRVFECEIRTRYSKRERWSVWRDATEEEKNRAINRIGDAEVARCVADSILREQPHWAQGQW